jgi:hypothetical protein
MVCQPQFDIVPSDTPFSYSLEKSLQARNIGGKGKLPLPTVSDASGSNSLNLNIVPADQGKPVDGFLPGDCFTGKQH